MTRAHVVAPVVVTDAPAMAEVLAAAVGLTPRQLRDLVDERGVPHGRRRPGARNIFVRVDDVLRALGLDDVSALASSPHAPTWNEAEIVELAARGRR